MDNLTPVSAIMKTDLVTLTPENSLLDVKNIFSKHNFHHLPVLEGKKLAGMFTESDLFQAYWDLGLEGKKVSEETLGTMKVKDYMTQKLAKIGPKERVDVAALIFMENRFHSLPVVDKEGHVLGMITTFDIIKHSFKLTTVFDKEKE